MALARLRTSPISAQRYPGLDLRSLERHVARFQEKIRVQQQRVWQSAAASSTDRVQGERAQPKRRPNRQSKRQLKAETEAKEADQPRRKKVRLQSRGEVSAKDPGPSTESVRAQEQGSAPRVCVAVTDTSIMDPLMYGLRKKRQRVQGVRTNPERPTLVAKVCEDGGELWLGAVPTRERLRAITVTPMHIQIGCFKKLPTEVWVDKRCDDSRGIFIPDAEYFRLEMSNPGSRQWDFRKLRTALLTSLRQGDNAYVHCMTGLCRAPLAASMLTSLIMNEDVDAAMKRVESLRNVQLDAAFASMGGSWMGKLVNERCAVHAQSDCYLVETSRLASTVVHAGVAGEKDHPLCKWRKGVALTWRYMARLETPEEARSYSDAFCPDCCVKLPASRRTQVKKVFHTFRTEAR